jgi:hypothetical protein
MTETTGALASALAKAQSVMKSAKFNKQNPHFKNKYADLASIIEATRKPLTDNGLSITQATEMNGSGFGLRTTLRHSSGESVDAFYPLPANAKPQELGSALTYARRYSLSSIVCIAADEDDDAEAAKHVEPETGEVIMADQVESLENMVTEIGGDRAAELKAGTLKYFKLTSFEDVPVREFGRVVAALEKKRAPK